MMRRRQNLFCILSLSAVVFFLSNFSSFVYSQSESVHVIRLSDDSINPVTAEYIVKAIDEAYALDARCLILELDTPGGLLTSTRAIVKKMLAAKVPVIVYIYPGGSRAGSAGVFITYASHIAAMAPSTNIGAAHPVQIGGGRKEGRSVWDAMRDYMDAKRRNEWNEEPVKEEAPSGEDAEYVEDNDKHPMESKILNDTVAFIRSIAKQRNRNTEWAELAVTQSESITEQEAMDKGVIDIIAKGENDLLQQLDGRTVKVEDKEIVLRTADAEIRRIEMDARQKLLNTLANPNIAYILMILGFYGLLYEVTHPGFGVPGVLGLIFLILAFFSMQTLPTNYAGLALIILAVALFIAEANVPGFGLLTLGGVVCMILGSLILFDSETPIMRVSFSVVLPLTLTTAAITVFLVRMVILAHKRRVMGGQEGMIGEKGKAQGAFQSGTEGKVFVHGEIWNALCDEDLKKDDRVEVVAVEGMMLKVKKIEP